MLILYFSKRESLSHLQNAHKSKCVFWQIPLDEVSKKQIAFIVPNRLCNAPQTLKRLMDKVIPEHMCH